MSLWKLRDERLVWWEKKFSSIDHNCRGTHVPWCWLAAGLPCSTWCLLLLLNPWSHLQAGNCKSFALPAFQCQQDVLHRVYLLMGWVYLPKIILWCQNDIKQLWTKPQGERKKVGKMQNIFVLLLGKPGLGGWCVTKPGLEWLGQMILSAAVHVYYDRMLMPCEGSFYSFLLF